MSHIKYWKIKVYYTWPMENLFTCKSIIVFFFLKSWNMSNSGNNVECKFLFYHKMIKFKNWTRLSYFPFQHWAALKNQRAKWFLAIWHSVLRDKTPHGKFNFKSLEIMFLLIYLRLLFQALGVYCTLLI